MPFRSVPRPVIADAHHATYSQSHIADRTPTTAADVIRCGRPHVLGGTSAVRCTSAVQKEKGPHTEVHINMPTCVAEVHTAPVRTSGSGADIHLDNVPSSWPLPPRLKVQENAR